MQTSGEAESALRHRARWSQPSGVGRGGASLQMLGEEEPAPGRRARWGQSPDIRRGGASPQTLGEVEPALVGWARQSLPLVVW